MSLSKQNARLDAVSKAKMAYVMSRATAEARLRERLADEMANLQTQIDLAVRYAFESGESKAAILRALGTKDYNTLNASLERTSLVTEIVGETWLDNVYQLLDDGKHLMVEYVEHGSRKLSGIATFNIVRTVDGRVMLLSVTPLWDEGYVNRNDVVAALDGAHDGEYYDEVVEWLGNQS
jgi:hypothetical protein